MPTCKFARLVEVDSDELSESGRVVIPHSLGVTPGLQHGVGLKENNNDDDDNEDDNDNDDDDDITCTILSSSPGSPSFFLPVAPMEAK